MSLYLKIPICSLSSEITIYMRKKWSNKLSKFHRLCSNCRGLVMFSYAFWQQGRACYIHMFDKIRHLSLCWNDRQYLSSKLIKVLSFLIALHYLIAILVTGTPLFLGIQPQNLPYFCKTWILRPGPLICAIFKRNFSIVRIGRFYSLWRVRTQKICGILWVIIKKLWNKYSVCQLIQNSNSVWNFC